jgi:predicted nucleic acid-binding protein
VKNVVVDTSLAIKWVVPEIHQPEALSLFAGWTADGTDVVVPSWFACELANVFFQRMRRGDMSLQDAQMAIRSIIVKVSVRDFEPSTAIRGIELASLLGLRASYDAHFLALAEHLAASCGRPTTDSGMRSRRRIRG